MAEPNEPTDETSPAPEGGAPGKPMGFLDHLEELRWTIMKSVAAFLAAFVVVAVFFDQTLAFLRWPLEIGLAGAPADSFTLISTSAAAIFGAYLMVCLLGALPLALPPVMFFIAQFVAPALTDKEKRLVVPAFIATLLLFFVGGAFSYFLLVPSLVKVSVASNAYMGVKLMLEVDKYFSMLVWMIVLMGLSFQFPVVIQILVYLDMVTVARLRSWRRMVVLGCAIAAALITPTGDPFNMMIVALPLYLLYEIALMVASGYTARKAARDRAEASAG